MLTKAYNNRVKYDIVVFVASPFTEEEKNSTYALAGEGVTVKFVLDNPGLKTMVNRLSPERKQYVFNRCNLTDYPENWEKFSFWTDCREKLTRGMYRLAYNWQAEFRSLHIWNYPVLKSYDWMLWIDTDGFASQVWKQDPIAFGIRNNLAMLFDNYPKGKQRGDDWNVRIREAFGHDICNMRLENGHLAADYECPNGSGIMDIHGFMHFTNLKFFRSLPQMYWSKILIGDQFCTRRYDDQAAVSGASVALAANYSWDMRSNGINLQLFHNYAMDGKEKAGGFKGWWKNNGKEKFPEAYGVCEITAAGR